MHNLQLSYRLAQELERDILVLKDALHLVNVGFLRIYFNNCFFYSCNNKSLVEDYYKYIKGTTIFFKESISSIREKENLILWPDIPNHYSMELYLKYNYWNGLTLIKESKDYVELCWGATTCQNNKHDYILYKDLFSKYISSLKERYLVYLQDIKVDELPIFTEGVDFSSLQYLQQKNNFGKVLSERENQCLNLISKGYSIKQISNILNLSVNTINTFVLRLKHKIGVHYKTELIDFFNTKTF